MPPYRPDFDTIPIASVAFIHCCGVSVNALSPQEMAYTYASEADILNMALFGKTAAQWRNEKGISGKTPNIRDFASAEELVVLINLEDTNADLIRQEVPKIERLKILREKAYRQLELLKKNQDTIQALKKNLIEDSRENN